MLPLIIDTDPGNGVPGSDVDDALAIALALQSPDVELLGLTTVAGNVALADATRCALALLELAGRTDVPVYAGAERPLVQDPTALRAALDRRHDADLVRELWARVPPSRPTTAPAARPAAEFLAETILARPGEVTLVTIGPLTNVALALRLAPRLAGAVRRIVIMGGAVRVPGLLTPATELNAAYDPEATEAVLQSGAPITLVGLDVTTRTSCTLADVARLRAAGSPLLGYLAEIAEPWWRYVAERRGLSGFWLHDPLAVAVALDPTLVTTRPMHVRVELTSPRFRGQTVGWDVPGRYQLPEERPNAEVCVDVDADRFHRFLFGRLGLTDRAPAG